MFRDRLYCMDFADEWAICSRAVVEGVLGDKKAQEERTEKGL